MRSLGSDERKEKYYRVRRQFRRLHTDTMYCLGRHLKSTRKHRLLRQKTCTQSAMYSKNSGYNIKFEKCLLWKKHSIFYKFFWPYLPSLTQFAMAICNFFREVLHRFSSIFLNFHYFPLIFRQLNSLASYGAATP